MYIPTNYILAHLNSSVILNFVVEEPMTPQREQELLTWWTMELQLQGFDDIVSNTHVVGNGFRYILETTF